MLKILKYYSKTNDKRDITLNYHATVHFTQLAIITTLLLFKILLYLKPKLIMAAF